MQRSSAKRFPPLDVAASVAGLVARRKPESITDLLQFLFANSSSNAAAWAPGKKLKRASLATSRPSHQPGRAVLVLSSLFYMLVTVPLVLA